VGPPREEEDEHADGRVRARGDARRRGDHHQGPVPVALPRVTFFHAPGCHLCDRAREVLAALAEESEFELTEVDISGEDELERTYREWLPVVEINGERAFVYTVDPDGFRRRIARA
jgi:glutaredoxin